MRGPVPGGGLRRLLRDPLGHFLLLGALLFAGYALFGGNKARTNASSPVVIGTGEVRWLTETWSRQWRREPTPEELRDLVTGLVREELLARAAREMRLDDDDVIVRRRLAQKLEFVLRDTTADGEPTEPELEGLLAGHPEHFRVEARRTFTQVLFSASRADPQGDAADALRQLSGSRHPSAERWGDPQLLPESLCDADEQSIAAAFGPGFAREVFLLDVGSWSGPVASSYGQHLVRIDSATAARQRSLPEARADVLELWRTVKAAEREAHTLAELRERYGVVLDEGVRRMIAPSRIVPATWNGQP
jgi:hypothetical protein